MRVNWTALSTPDTSTVTSVLSAAVCKEEGGKEDGSPFTPSVVGDTLGTLYNIAVGCNKTKQHSCGPTDVVLTVDSDGGPSTKKHRKKTLLEFFFKFFWNFY